MGTVRFKIDVEGHNCDDATMAELDRLATHLRDIFQAPLTASGAEFVSKKTVSQDGTTVETHEEVTQEAKLAARVRELYQLSRDLKQLLVDADEVARQRGDTHGLCDAISNTGEAYPSAYCAALIEEFRVIEKIKPILFIKDLEG
jgi:hypothetical protein